MDSRIDDKRHRLLKTVENSEVSVTGAERQIIAVVDEKKSPDDTKRSEKKSELETEFRNILSLERLNVSRSRRAPRSSLDPDGCTDTREWESKLDVRRKRF